MPSRPKRQLREGKHFLCPSCGVRYRQKYDLSRHMRAQHPVPVGGDKAAAAVPGALESTSLVPPGDLDALQVAESAPAVAKKVSDAKASTETVVGCFQCVCQKLHCLLG